MASGPFCPTSPESQQTKENAAFFFPFFNLAVRAGSFLTPDLLTVSAMQGGVKNPNQDRNILPKM